MLLVDVVGRVGASAPEQIGAIAVNVGTMVGVTVMVKVAVVAHWPPFGVNVYVADVVLLTVAGLHVPVILLLEVVGSVGAVAPEQIGAIASNSGTTRGLTVTSMVVVSAH
jgi:hypothetical protein